MLRPLVVANWKMNGSRDLCSSYAAHLEVPDGVDIWVAPPSIFLQQLHSTLSEGARIGVQNVHTKMEGAFTGEISAQQAQEIGAAFAIVGHSERRQYSGESDQQVAEKFLACIDAAITPILCVGETLDQRNAGRAKENVAKQINAVKELSGPQAFGRGVIAYEPVWAIGTGVAATAEDAQSMHDNIRSLISSTPTPEHPRQRILYGGSVKSSNAESLISQPDIDGFLVGGASLDVEEFNVICKTVQDY